MNSNKMFHKILALVILGSLYIKIYCAPLCGQMANVCYEGKINQFDPRFGNSTCGQTLATRKLVQCGTQADNLAEFLRTASGLAKGMRSEFINVLLIPSENRITNITATVYSHLTHHQKPTSCCGQGCCDFNLPTCGPSNTQSNSLATASDNCPILVDPVATATCGSVANSNTDDSGTSIADTATVESCPIVAVPTMNTRNCAVLVPSAIDCMFPPQNTS